MFTHSLKAISLIIILGWPSYEISPQEWSSFILWNVGQGQWITFSSPSHCIHFDMGGEKVRWTQVQRECQNKNNWLFISHGDWDHLSFVYQARRKLKRLCLKNNPVLPQKRKNFFKSFPRCQGGSLETSEIHFHFKPRFRKKQLNDNSHVFGINHFLIPGDSTKKMERQWLHGLHPHKYKVLVLGHHGSRTSTSVELLDSLPYLKQAVTSSRKTKYGHPHRIVQDRLVKYGIPLISTEDWGTIRLPVRSSLRHH